MNSTSYIFDLENITNFVFGNPNEKTNEVEITEEYKNISNIDYLLEKILLIPLQIDYNINQEYFNILAQY